MVLLLLGGRGLLVLHLFTLISYVLSTHLPTLPLLPLLLSPTGVGRRQQETMRGAHIPAEAAPEDNTLPAAAVHHTQAEGDRIAGVHRSRAEGRRRAVAGIDLPF